MAPSFHADVRSLLMVLLAFKGSDCFCGAATDLTTPTAEARIRPKSECMESTCDADLAEKECGGPGRLLAYVGAPRSTQAAPQGLGC